ncbi:MAG: type II secretion system protein [Clostridiales bacterium]|jgi:type IV pilus assembly protein PilA|nr:type II secretion system protein [Clostridiales bacterium]
MENKRNRKGFTLAELLIVVAIIAVLVAIAIPVFTGQLEKSREATDMANIRAAYGTVTTQYLTDGSEHEATVTAQQKQADWQDSTLGKLETMNETGTSEVTVSAKTNGNDYTVKINASGSVTVE